MLTEYSDNLIGQLMDWRGICSSADALPVVKRELSMKAKLSIYRLVYIPALAYGDELWLVIKRMRSQIQNSGNFLRRVAGLSLSNSSSVIFEELRVELLLVHTERR